VSIERFTPPGWPEHVQVLATTRVGGVSPAPFDTLNLGAHVGDDDECVEENRRRLRAALPEGCAPFWLTQVHGRDVVTAEAGDAGSCPRADASWTREPGVACAVLTADCLPILLTDRAGELVAAVHAGWRGLATGIVEAALDALPVEATRLLAWLGPAIGPSAFEVGEEVRDAFLYAATGASRLDAEQCFRPGLDAGKWFADLHALARLRLNCAGVSRIAADERCTFSNPREFFSYRRDGPTGRMAYLVFRRG
jgi:YfiH family protein